jgi:hypothetical protein
MKDTRPTICVDFDGVIHSYTSGWQGIDVIPDDPVPGAIEWLRGILDVPKYGRKPDVRVVIYSSRSRTWKGRRAMLRWFSKYLEPEYVIPMPTKKPAAFLTIDDRAICFKGSFPSVEEMLSFKPWKVGCVTRDNTALHSLLLLVVEKEIPMEKIESLSDEEYEYAVDWAGKVHLKASDNPVQVPNTPTWLKDEG